MNEIAKLTGNHMHRSGNVCSERECQYAPRVNGTHTRCRCGNYPRTDIQGFCTVCGAGFMADWEWELITAGSPDDYAPVRIENLPDAPVTVTVHTLDGKSFPVPGIREDSITWESRKGIPTLVMERDGSDAIVYAPNVAYYVTVCE